MTEEELRSTAARWRLGYLTTGDVRKLLGGWLVDGDPGPALIDAFALSSDQLSYREAEVMPLVFEELGVAVPSVPDAWHRLAVTFARDHVEGRADASATTDAFFDLVLELEFDPSLSAPVFELYELHEHMQWVETDGRSYDGTPADEIYDRVRKAAEGVVDELGQADSAQ